MSWTSPPVRFCPLRPFLSPILDTGHPHFGQSLRGIREPLNTTVYNFQTTFWTIWTMVFVGRGAYGAYRSNGAYGPLPSETAVTVKPFWTPIHLILDTMSAQCAWEYREDWAVFSGFQLFTPAQRTPHLSYLSYLSYPSYVLPVRPLHLILPILPIRPSNSQPALSLFPSEILAL